MSTKKKSDSLERLYIAIGIMENYCHEFAEKRLGAAELKVMRRDVIKIVEYILET